MAPSPVVAWLPHCVCARVCAHMCTCVCIYVYTMHMCAAPTCECVTDRGCLHMPCFRHLCFLFVCCLGGHLEINTSHRTWSLLLSVGWLASKPPGPTCFPDHAHRYTLLHTAVPDSGDQTWVFLLYCKHLTHQAFSTAWLLYS